MPAYNFKPEFADAIQTGRKRQTIRPKRKRPTKAGDTLHLYTGMRTKSCYKLGEFTCKSVQPIEIHSTYIELDGTILTNTKRHELAWADGFSGLVSFYDFFRSQYGVPHDIELELITW